MASRALGLALTLGVAVAVTGGLCGLAMALGSGASTQVRNPSSVAEGAVCQLFDDGQGHQPVRCARLFAAPPATVAALVRDYAHYDQVYEGRFWHFEVRSVTPEPDGRTHFVGRVRTRLGSWELDARVRSDDSQGNYRDSWDQQGGALRTNRGSWSVEAQPGGGSLLVYSLELDVRNVPRFLVNDVLLVELRSPLRRIGRRLEAAR